MQGRCFKLNYIILDLKGYKIKNKDVKILYCSDCCKQRSPTATTIQKQHSGIKAKINISTAKIEYEWQHDTKWDDWEFNEIIILYSNR